VSLFVIGRGVVFVADLKDCIFYLYDSVTVPGRSAGAIVAIYKPQILPVKYFDLEFRNSFYSFFSSIFFTSEIFSDFSSGSAIAF